VTRQETPASPDPELPLDPELSLDAESAAPLEPSALLPPLDEDPAPPLSDSATALPPQPKTPATTAMRSSLP
jgi:hypothetical protein